MYPHPSASAFSMTSDVKTQQRYELKMKVQNICPFFFAFPPNNVGEQPKCAMGKCATGTGE
jgi:hypothetical protein